MFRGSPRSLGEARPTALTRGQVYLGVRWLTLRLRGEMMRPEGVVNPARQSIRSPACWKDQKRAHTHNRRVVILVAVAALVLSCGLLIALSDAGLPIPAAVVIVAGAIGLLAVGAASIVGYRSGRKEGLGFWRAIGRGFRAAGRVLLDLF